MISIKHLVAIGLLVSLSGCSTVPNFGTIVDREALAPRVDDVVKEVQCEIVDAALAFGEFKANKYVANVNLTLDVTNNQGINPSLSYINPYKTMGVLGTTNNFSASLDAQLSGQQHRNINQTFTLYIDGTSVELPNRKAQCDEVRRKNPYVHGNLKIKGIIAAGLQYEQAAAYILPAYGVNLPINGADNNPVSGSPLLAPNFGSTIDFTLIYGVGGGPNWALTRFDGPYSAEGTFPSTGGLLNYLRTNKDTVVLSFARIGPSKPKAERSKAPGAKVEEEVELMSRDDIDTINAAGQSAQANVTRMILQRLLIP